MSTLLPFALAARNAGMENFIDSEALKKVIVCLSKEHAPPDPRYSMKRTLVGYGKGSAGERFAVPGIMAKALSSNDPKLAAQLQWVWNVCGNSLNIANRTMTGFEDFVLDRDLPAKASGWVSELDKKVPIHPLFLQGALFSSVRTL